MACDEDIEIMVLGNVAVVRNIPGRPFADPDTGEAINPTSVYLTAKNPSSAETVYQYGVDSEISRTGTGYYRAEVAPDIAGDWTFTLWSTGDGQGAAYKTVRVISP